MITNPEHLLCQSAGRRLRELGYKVIAEVPFGPARHIDLVGVRGAEVAVIEAKTCFTRTLQSQIYGASWHSDLAIAVVATRPRTDKVAWCRKHRIGLWKVNGEGLIETIVTPVPITDQRRNYRERLIDRANRMPESLDGGKPCSLGVGPARDVEARMKEYKVAHPEATWREMWQAIPNHYQSPSSMRTSYSRNRQRREWRELAKAKRAA